MGSALIYCTVCLFMPLTAWAVINHDWQFHIPLINIVYKPWRLYIIACSLPEVIIGIVFVFLPESPKFVLGQGDKAKAYEILLQMNRWNNGSKSQLGRFELYEEPESIENRQRILDCKMSRFPLLKSIWIQTAPLFKSPYLFSTALICAIQFGTYATYNGLFMFFAEINNKMAANLDNFYDQRIMMCDAINLKPINVTTPEFDVVDREVNSKIYWKYPKVKLNFIYALF